ncbi:MAG: ATP-binding protein [Sphingomonadaceae bacterium]|nr:ATP-binding protein [Sphingomonadaceae bacterium]
MLDAHGPEDQTIFFGRDSEIKALHKLSFQSYLVLVYGPSGTGKTSLVQCGLSSRFKSSAWLPLTIRRCDDINRALIEALRGAASREAEMEGLDAVGAVRELFLDQLRPIYLIFDQFEKLFTFGTQEERDDFFVTLKQIIDTAVNAKVIIFMREEFLARLDRYEDLIPTIFSKRLRVDPMFTSQLCAVINGTAAKMVPPITLERPLWPAAAERLRERREARRPPMQPFDQAAVVAEIVAALEQARLIREVGGFYELAHDSLAAQVAAMRSAERAAVLRAEKMVRDCVQQSLDRPARHADGVPAA